jgi:hypothetical protein
MLGAIQTSTIDHHKEPTVSTRFTKSVARTALAAGALGIAALVAAGTASANSADTAFIDALTKAGIQVNDTQEAVKTAHGVCNALDQGASGREIAHALGYQGEMNSKQIKVFMLDSVQAYCPEFLQDS